MFQPLNAPLVDDDGAEMPDLPAAAELGKKQDQYDEEEIMAMYSQALLLLGERNFGEAEAELEKLRGLFSSRSSGRREHKLTFPVLMNLAECFSAQGRNDDAISTLIDACTMNPKNSTPWFKLGCLLVKFRSVYDAISAFKEAISNCPGIHWVSLTKLCQCLFVIGLYDDCIYYCLRGLNENSFFATGHTLLLEIVKEEKSILRYNTPLKENIGILDGQFYDPKIISECENIRSQHVQFVTNLPVPVKSVEFNPSTKLLVNSRQKVTLSEICRYLTRACEEALSSSLELIDVPIKVQKDAPMSSSEDPQPTATGGSQRHPTTPQQTTRQSRLSSLALSKTGVTQTPAIGSMRLKLLKYIAQLRPLVDSSEATVIAEPASILARRSSASTLSIDENVSVAKLAEYDTTDDVKLLFEEGCSLRELTKHFLDLLVQQASLRSWEKDDVVAFCTLFQQFRRFTQLKPYSSLEDTWNVSVCTIARVFLEALIEFLTYVEGKYEASYVSPSVELDLTDEIDCVTLPSLLCSTRIADEVKRKEATVRHCLLFFRLSKVTHNFELMQLASSSCRSVLDSLPGFNSLLLGHVFHHPVWRRDEILMEMKWTHCYEQLRSRSEIFEQKDWEAICAQVGDSDIFDASNVDLIISSDLANYSVIFAEALFRCSKPNAPDTLVMLLSCLLATMTSAKQAPMLKQLLSDAWQLCYEQFEKMTVPAARSSFAKLMISSAEAVFGWLENNGSLPFNCAGLICSLYAGFSQLVEMGNSSMMPIRLDFSLMDAPTVVESEMKHADDSSSFDEDEDSDFAKLPPGVKFLILFHDVLVGSGGSCRSDNGVYLDLIRDRLVEFLQGPAAFEEGMTKAARTVVEKQIDQCVFCQLGVTLRRIRAKSTQVSEHPSNKPVQQQQQLTWQRGIKLYLYYRPRDLPAYDSFKGDSISAEFGSFLKKLLALSPASPALTESELDDYLCGPNEGTEAFLNKLCELKTNSESQSGSDQQHYASICYLMADHVVKNAEYTDALEHYKTAIRFQPTLFDAWAGLALSWQSSVTAMLDECDTSTRHCDPELLQPIVRSFKMALALEPSNGKLQMEYASFVFDVYSLVCRIERNKSRRRQSGTQFSAEQIAAKFVGCSAATNTDLLKLGFDAFARSNASKDIDPPSDRWFSLYMLGKLGGKLGHDIDQIVNYFVEALELLFEHDAVFPGRTVSSQNAPRHAIECFELFYRLHTDILKCLAGDDIVKLASSKLDAEAQEKLKAEVDEKIEKLSSLVKRVYLKRFTSMPAFADFCNNKSSEKASENSPIENDEPAEKEEMLTDANLTDDALSKARELAYVCIHALAFCSTRFPEHFKSRYRMARVFFDHPLITNSVLCGHVLLGWPIPEDENKGPFAGVKFGSSLFDPRKIQSGSTGAMLTGFWRSPHSDIDRRGTFFDHTEKCVRLLLQFLRSCNTNPDAWKLLNAAHVQLARPASSARRYLRDTDQSGLALKSLELAVETLTSSLSVESPCSREKLLDVYRLQQLVVRGGFVSLIEKTTCLLIACYCSSQIVSDANKLGEEQFSPPTVTEVERICQNLIIQEKQQQKAASRRQSMSVGSGDAERDVENLLRSVVDRIVSGSVPPPPS